MDEEKPVKPIVATDHDSFCGSWWFVCPRCKIAVDYQDKKCDHCGQPFVWK